MQRHRDSRRHHGLPHHHTYCQICDRENNSGMWMTTKFFHAPADVLVAHPCDSILRTRHRRSSQLPRVVASFHGYLPPRTVFDAVSTSCLNCDRSLPTEQEWRQASPVSSAKTMAHSGLTSLDGSAKKKWKQSPKTNGTMMFGVAGSPLTRRCICILARM